MIDYDNGNGIGLHNAEDFTSLTVPLLSVYSAISTRVLEETSRARDTTFLIRVPAQVNPSVVGELIPELIEKSFAWPNTH